MGIGGIGIFQLLFFVLIPVVIAVIGVTVFQWAKKRNDD